MLTQKCLLETENGKWPADSERLNSSATNGASTSETCCKTEVLHQQ